MSFFRYRPFLLDRLPFISFFFAIGLLVPQGEAAQKRCDFLAKSTPGPGAITTCLDLLAMKTWTGPPMQTAQNATRISRDGFTLCKSAFQMSSGAQADIAFIYDNSGSMVSKFAWIDPATHDTLFYYDGFGCTSDPNASSLAPLTYQTQEGPRTVPQIASNAGCQDRSGDPYNARGAVIRQGIDFLGTSSPNSTGAAIAFNGFLAHLQAPKVLNTPANLFQVKNSIVLDTSGGTKYGAPLRQANLWLTDTLLTHTAKQAIVFISDGAPEDTTGSASYMNSIPKSIPIFSIFLGDPTTDYAKLKDLSSRTGGVFYRVDPNNVAKMNEVMQQIIRAITVPATPRSVEISNTSFDPDQVSRSVAMLTNPDTSVTVTLDSILGLKKGLNDITVKIVLGDSLIDNYTFKVQAEAAEATQSTSSLACYDQPTLVMLNAHNQVDSVYAHGPATYDIRLTRSPSEITGTTVSASTQDALKNPPITDAEAIFLPADGTVSGVVTNQRNTYPFDGSVLAPSKNNGILEAAPSGKVVLTWSHPRDARETATFFLPAQKIPAIPGFITVERVINVTKGLDLSGSVSDPVVIRGGAVLTRLGADSVMLTSRGCLYNCTDNAIRFSDPIKTPSFLFKTASPFSFKLHLFDNLGHFILKAAGTVKTADWQAMPKSGDSVAVVMSIIPVAANGQLVGTGVYILSATITTVEMAGNNPAVPSNISGLTRGFVNKFGYIRAPH